MKKKILYLAVTTALVLSSCSNDETTAVNQGEAISFRSSVSGVTRASSVANVTTANIPSFTVNAMNAGTESSYFSNALFTRVDATSTFTSGTKYYWPPTGSLDFYAYSPAGNSQVTYTDYKTFTITPTSGTNPENQVDFVYASTKGKSKLNSATGVVLNFRHTGAKIACKVQNTSSTLKFGVDGWKVGYLYPNGTFVFADANTDGKNTGSGTTLTFAQWTPGGTKAYSVEYASTFTKKDIAVNASATDLDGEFVLVPQTLTAATAYANNGTAAVGDKLNNTFIAVKLYILNSTGSELVAGGGDTTNPTTIWAIWPTGGYNWEPGKKYTYTIDLAGGGYYETNQNTDEDLDALLPNVEIKFINVTVDDWTTVNQ
ncbi:MAG: fimbrillin family protein [Prevotella sp.]|nr:fimbrillin family protein [Prevotella sp.]